MGGPAGWGTAGLPVRLAAVLAMLPAPAFCQQWHDQAGSPYAETESTRTLNGFAASLVVTSDADWQAKWETPADATPAFTAADHVGAGEQVFVLTFLANPALDDQHRARVECDLRVVRADGSESSYQQNIPCLSTRIDGDPRNVYLSAAVIVYRWEPSDPKGPWTVEVTAHDRLRDTHIPLRTHFTVE